ncbi:hypothetical protein [Plasticicumulans acidivorans]|uniref:Uncharacterized protein n=1 Tax=Plasticicumulans acidivorans TaxID=886464 RepID=A0A317N152_9GAMM|nr:hypothetical protein [Plasticicumulans acidivorans]PWV65993.1 hypothetical protein C7443_101481 [Plasticicumulans acidivorans]
MIAVLDPLAVAAATARAARLLAGSSDPRLEIYSDPVPAVGAAPDAATLLAVWTIDRADISASGRALVITVPATAPMVAAAGAATWCRLIAGDAVAMLDGDVGDDTSTALVRISGGTYLRAGELLVLSSALVLTES